MRSITQRAGIRADLADAPGSGRSGRATSGRLARPAEGSDRYGGASAAPSTSAPAGAPDHAARRPPRPAPASPRVPARCPTTKGQVWREYDIRPYTLRVTSTDRPEQAIVDWILRETGYEAWHSEPVGLLQRQPRRAPRLSHAGDAGRRGRHRRSLRQLGGQRLRLHAPRRHGRQSELAGQGAADDDADPRAVARRARLAAGQGKRAAAGLRAEPAHRLPRIQLVAAACEQRPVDRASRRCGRGSYVRGAIATQTAWPGYQPEMGTLEEGFSLEFSPLLALDLASADAVVKLRLNQVEKMLPVKLDLPTVVAPNQRVRGRSAADDDRQSARAVPLADRQGAAALRWASWPRRRRRKDNPLTDAMTDAVPMLKSPPRADALLFVESAGR